MNEELKDALKALPKLHQRLMVAEKEIKERLPGYQRGVLFSYLPHTSDKHLQADVETALRKLRAARTDYRFMPNSLQSLTLAMATMPKNKRVKAQHEAAHLMELRDSMRGAEDLLDSTKIKPLEKIK